MHRAISDGLCQSISARWRHLLFHQTRLCVTREMLVQEYGEEAKLNGCMSLAGGSVNYCTCSQQQLCNQRPIIEQITDYTRQSLLQLENNNNNNNNLLPQKVSGMIDGQQNTQLLTSSTISTSVTAPKKTEEAVQAGISCYVCGESDSMTASDCSKSYQYECARQYPNETDIYCLTRITKLASSKFNIEKRCISRKEHSDHYPSSEIGPVDGCGSAYNGHVKYCVCQTDLCNMYSLQRQNALIHRPGQQPPANEDGSERGRAETVPQPTSLLPQVERPPIAKKTADRTLSTDPLLTRPVTYPEPENEPKPEIQSPLSSSMGDHQKQQQTSAEPEINAQPEINGKLMPEINAQPDRVTVRRPQKGPFKHRYDWRKTNGTVDFTSGNAIQSSADFGHFVRFFVVCLPILIAKLL